jgi:hypothetical protein
MKFNREDANYKVHTHQSKGKLTNNLYTFFKLKFNSSNFNFMELISKNDGLLTNIEVLEVIRENRKQSSIHISNSSAQVELQNREYVENKVCLMVSNNV